MIYLLKFFYSWLLPPAVIVLLLLGLGWRLRKKNASAAVGQWRRDCRAGRR